MLGVFLPRILEHPGQCVDKRDRSTFVPIIPLEVSEHKEVLHANANMQREIEQVLLHAGLSVSQSVPWYIALQERAKRRRGESWQ